MQKYIKILCISFLFLGLIIGCKTESEVSLVSLSITSCPTKTSYVQGEALDLTGLIIIANYSDGTTETVN